MIIISDDQFNALDTGLDRHSLSIMCSQIERQCQQNNVNLEPLTVHDLAQRMRSLCQRSGVARMDSMLFLAENVLRLGLQHKLSEATDATLPGVGHTDKVRIERYIAELSTDSPPPFIRLPEENAIMDYFHG